MHVRGSGFDCGWVTANFHFFKVDFQSVLRSRGICFHFCLEFVDTCTLHFGNSVRKVFESAINYTSFRLRETSVWNTVEFLLLLVIVLQGYLLLVMKKKVSVSHFDW